MGVCEVTVKRTRLVLLDCTPTSPVVQSSDTVSCVSCVSLSFRTHACVLAIKPDGCLCAALDYLCLTTTPDPWDTLAVFHKQVYLITVYVISTLGLSSPVVLLSLECRHLMTESNKEFNRIHGHSYHIKESSLSQKPLSCLHYCCDKSVDQI